MLIIALPHKQRLANHHFYEDTAECPYIYSEIVALLSENHLWRSIPKCRNAQTLFLLRSFEYIRHSEITNSHILSVSIKKDVRRL